MDADPHSVALDLPKTAHTLSIFVAASDGSLCQKETNASITLLDATNRTRPNLDTAAMLFMASVPADMASAGVNFDTGLFNQNVVSTTFDALKNLRFKEMGTAAFDNVQAALSKSQQDLRSSAHKNELFVIQQY